MHSNAIINTDCSKHAETHFRHKHVEHGSERRRTSRHMNGPKRQRGWLAYSRNVEVMSVWAPRLCQQVLYYCSYLLFVDREPLLTYWEWCTECVHSLNNGSPKPTRPPVACHSFPFSFLHTFSFMSVSEAAVGACFLRSPISLSLYPPLMPILRLHPNGFV